MNATGVDEYAAFRDLMRLVVQRIAIPIVMTVGVVGNSLSFVVLTQKRMRSSTNCYLAALACFDTLYLIFNFSMSLVHAPGVAERKSYVNYMPWGFPLADLCSNTSVWLVVTFTVERYVAVCHPLRGRPFCTVQRAKVAIACVFTLAFLAVFPTFLEWKSGWLKDGNETIYWIYENELVNSERYRSVYYWFTAFMFSFIPIVSLIIFNGFLIQSVHRSRHQRCVMTQQKRGGDASLQETKITIMLIIVVVVFLICQLPSAVLLIVSKEIPERSPKENLVIGFNNISNLLMAINATCNFFLYCFLSDRFRRTFVKIFCPWCSRAASPSQSSLATSQCVTYATSVGHNEKTALAVSCNNKVMYVNKHNSPNKNANSSESSPKKDPTKPYYNRSNYYTLQMDATNSSSIEGECV
ncbi:PREDICTED: FMRFamide receptor-like [Priapulus caudatus]|uniref:FMRFamide receptor-like n=1 Tax=Priapulus caudatus TaxID=37621 RepID=A0ABM1DUF8_PRICU|nr:PREDICTED: FMRFamide receptor-like [Priapulus caudatus]